MQRLTQYMFACQEEVVRQCPTQWFMFRRFWPADARGDHRGDRPRPYRLSRTQRRLASGAAQRL